MLKGYVDPKWMPVLPGMKARIKKGTMLRSMHPEKKGPFPAGRTYEVKVHHVLPGQTSTIGVIAHQGTEDERLFISGMHWRELHHKCKRLGIDYPYGPDVDEKWLLQELKKTGRLQIHDYIPHRQSMRLHESNPTVRWAGSGRYWTEADINDVEIIGWFVDMDGVLQDLSERAVDTFQVEAKKGQPWLNVHIGAYEEGQGFRVDESYVLHLDKPSL